MVSGRILVVSGRICWYLVASGALLQFGGIWLPLLVSAGIELATGGPCWYRLVSATIWWYLLVFGGI